MIAAMCVAEAAGMLSFATFPALLPTFMDEWSLSATEAGWLSGLFFAGYMVAVPLLSGLTDRYDARRIFLASAVLSGAATLAFAFLATDFWSAVPLRLIAGAGMAGTYMPGLRALTDRIPVESHPRAVSFYTASFSVGASGSYLFAGLINEWLNWQWAFALSAIGPGVYFLAVMALMRPKPLARHTIVSWAALFDFRPVLRNREAMAYILAYSAHNWELFGYRSWIVAFLAFSVSLQPDPGVAIISATAIAAALNLLGLPSSVIGNEIATRFGRRKVVATIMALSAVVGIAVGLSPGLPYIVVVALLALYGVTITGESASVTTGTVLAAPPERKGAAMAMHSLLGFAFAFLGSLAPGVALDLFGGTSSEFAWSLAFIVMALGAATGPVILFVLAKGQYRRAPIETR